MTVFTEKQLKLLLRALDIADKSELNWWRGIGRGWDADALVSDLSDMLQLEREAKRERKKSLAIERRIKGD